MHDPTSTDTQGMATTPASDNGGGKSQTPPSDLDQQFQALDEQINKVQAAITEKQDKLQASGAELDKDRAQQKALEATRNDLKSVVNSSKADQLKVAQQRDAAMQEGEDAYQELQQIRKELDDQLADDYTERVHQAITQVDQQTDKFWGEVRSKQDELSQAEASLIGQKDAAAKAQAGLRQAQADIRVLPAQIQAAVAELKKSRLALQNAYSRGPAKEAYMLVIELDRSLDRLAALIDAKYELALAMHVQEAWAAYSSAGAGISQAEDLVQQRKDELTPLTASLKDYQDNRRKKIEDLLAAEQPEQGGGMQSPAEQKGGTQTPPVQEAETAAAFAPATQP